MAEPRPIPLGGYEATIAPGLAQVFKPFREDTSAKLKQEELELRRQALSQKEKQAQAKEAEKNKLKIDDKGMFHAHRPAFRQMGKQYRDFVLEHSGDDDFEEQNAVWQDKLKDFAYSSTAFANNMKSVNQEILQEGEDEFEGMEEYEKLNNPQTYLDWYEESGDDPYAITARTFGEMDKVRKKAQPINYLDRISTRLVPLVKNLSAQGKTWYPDEKTGRIININTEKFDINEAQNLIDNDLDDAKVYKSAERIYNDLPEETKKEYEKMEDPVKEYFKTTYSPYLVKDVRHEIPGGPVEPGGGLGISFGVGSAETKNYRFEYQDIESPSKMVEDKEIVRLARKDASENKELIFTDPATGSAIKAIPTAYERTRGGDWKLKVVITSDNGKGETRNIDKKTASPIIRANYEGFDIDKFQVPEMAPRPSSKQTTTKPATTKPSSKAEQLRNKYGY